MSKLKTIVGTFVNSNEIKKKRIFFNSKGIIEKIEDKNISALSNDDFVFNDDCLIFAGMGDIHIHAREDMSQKNIYKESFATCCEAALNGGVVHVADMPNNPIPPVDDQSYKDKVELSKNHSLPFLMYAGIGPATRPLSFQVPYKAFMGPSIGDLFFKDNRELETSIAHYKNQWVSFHCEDPEVLEQNKNQVDHFSKRPLKAENLATDVALNLIEKYQLKGKLCHYSSGEGLEKIIAAKKRGVNVTCEVTPQHLFFTEEKIKNQYKDQEVLFQMNPPIRHESDRLRLLTALKEGFIDFLATDHAPHSEEEKRRGTSGMPGLDTFALFTTWLILNEQVDPKIIAKVASENPGDFFNQFYRQFKNIFPHYQKYGEGLGHLLPGYSASFTVLNLKRPKLFTKDDLKSKAHWGPFIGFEFPGSIESVILCGEKR